MAKDEQTKKAHAANEKLKRAFNTTAETPAGLMVLRYLMRDCGFGQTSLVMNPQTFEINTVGSVYNEARKDVYIRIRKLLSKENLRKIELEEETNA